MKDGRLNVLSITNIEGKVLNMVELNDILYVFIDKKHRKQYSAKPS